MTGVYLAYPIDQRTGTTAMTSLFHQIEAFKARCIDEIGVEWVFDPGDAFRVSGKVESGDVALINRHAHSCADWVVAFLPAGVPTVGVPMEIDRGMSQGKNVIIFSDTDSYMLDWGPRVGKSLWKVKDWSDQSLTEALNLIRHTSVQARERYFPNQYLPFKVDRPELLPTRTYYNDAGLDLIVSERTYIDPGAFVDIPCGSAVELPDTVWGLVQGRSSTLRKRQLLVNPGIVDSGYRGPLFAGVWNLGNDQAMVEPGDRLAQLILIGSQSRHYDPVRVDELAPSERGSNGFGSSGS